MAYHVTRCNAYTAKSIKIGIMNFILLFAADARNLSNDSEEK